MVTLSCFVDAKLGYSLAVPSGLVVGEIGRTNSNGEVRLHPDPGRTFVPYLDTWIGPRALETRRALPVQDARMVELNLAGRGGVQFKYPGGRCEMYQLYLGRVCYPFSNRPADEKVEHMISSFACLP